MKILIVPVKVLTGDKGMVTVTQVDVRCASYELGQKARFSWEAQSLDDAGNGQQRTVTRANGVLDLTPEQFAAWHDDTQVARDVVRAAGMEPMDPVTPSTS